MSRARRTPEQVAADIAANCDSYNAGEQSYEAWTARQFALWDEAHARGDRFERAVLRIVCPPREAAP